MTESEWLASDDPEAMLRWCSIDRPTANPRQAMVGDRKLRLYACACVRQAWPLLADARSRSAVEAAERFADGASTPDALDAAADALRRLAGRSDLLPTAAWCCARRDLPDFANQTATLAAWALSGGVGRGGGKSAALAALLRCVVGDPFRPVTLPETGSPCPWLASTALAVAQAVYADRDFDALPVLADALVDAGCTDEAILAHLRGPGPHALGCWVLDLVLGKQ